MPLTRLTRCAIAVSLAGLCGLAASRMPVPEERPYDVPVVPTAGALRWLFPSHATLAANLYWLRTVQYIGEERTAERGWDRLLPLAELVTDLDPKHGYVYQVTSTMLSTVGRVEESNKVLEKGMRNVPDRYILPYHRAFNAFYYQGDFEAAGRYAEIAARIPGAPEHLRQNVLAYYVKGNRADLAVRFLEDAYEAANDDESRKAIEEQLAQARVEQAAAIVDRGVARWRARFALPPVTPLSLVLEGFLPRLPVDPAGGEWVLDAEGRAHSTAHEARIARAPRASELPREPGLDPSRLGAPR